MYSIIIAVLIPILIVPCYFLMKRVYKYKELYSKKYQWLWENVLVKIIDYYFVTSEQKLLGRLISAYIAVFVGIPIVGKLFIHTTYLTAYLDFDSVDVYSLVAFALLCITFCIMLYCKRDIQSKKLSPIIINNQVSPQIYGSNNALSNQINQNVGQVINYYANTIKKDEFVLPKDFYYPITLHPKGKDELDFFFCENVKEKPCKTTTSLYELVTVLKDFFVDPQDSYSIKTYLKDNFSNLETDEVNNIINKLTEIDFLSRTNALDAYGCNIVTYGPGVHFDDYLKYVGTSKPTDYSRDAYVEKEFVSSHDLYIKIRKDFNYNSTESGINLLISSNADMSGELDKNLLFILGRNILSSAFHGCRRSRQLLTNLEEIVRFNDPRGDNHILNGILYEIFFDCSNNLRKEIRGEEYLNYYKSNIKNKFYSSYKFINDKLESTGIKPFVIQ